MAQQNLQPEQIAAPLAEERPLRVLVVDDSALQRRLLSKPLKDLGYEVREAPSALIALEMCDELLPDVVISDWMMPGMTGLEFCKAFRELTGDVYRYFILVTSKSEKMAVAEGLDAGADDFLVKPINSAELRARITAGERIVRMQRELSEKNRLVRITLDELQRVYDVLDSDLMDARKFQESLIRERSKTLPEGQISLLLRSAGHVGGDLVGFFEIDSDTLCVYSIDVSGHGISSALMTARLAGNLSATAPEQNVALKRVSHGQYTALPPDEVIEKLNTLVLDEMETEHYFTMLLAFVDVKSGKVRLSQAGHPHPVVLRKDGQVDQSGDGGFPVGLIEGMTYDSYEIDLAPGDRLLLFSDGVTECPAPDDSLLGEEGLAEMLFDLRGMNGMELFDGLIWSMSRFAEVEDFPDDVSGVLFEYSGPAEPQPK